MNEQEAINLLKKYSNDEKTFDIVLKHSKKVQEMAFRIAKKIEGVDLEFVKISALLHDIGRFSSPSTIRHGVVGGEILRKEGYEKLAQLTERHLGIGITKEDIINQKLDLPEKDFVPITIEEKIVAYADNLVFGDKEGTIQEVMDRFRKEFGEAYVKKIKKLHDELQKLMGKQDD